MTEFNRDKLRIFFKEIKIHKSVVKLFLIIHV
jgi:hypothetical protein